MSIADIPIPVNKLVDEMTMDELTGEELRLVSDQIEKVFTEEMLNTLTLAFNGGTIFFKNLCKLLDIASVFFKQLQADPRFEHTKFGEIHDSQELKDSLSDFIKKYNLTPTETNTANEVLKSIIPKKYCIPNNKLANEMTKDFLGCGKINCTVAKRLCQFGFSFLSNQCRNRSFAQL